MQGRRIDNDNKLKKGTGKDLKQRQPPEGKKSHIESRAGIKEIKHAIARLRLGMGDHIFLRLS